jgi:hypothetical protein
MLEKEFVPYDESLEFKALGFNEPCFAFHNHNHQLVRYMNPDKDWNSLFNQTLRNSKITLPDTYTAPTFSQAFEFFREKYQMVFCYEPCLKKDLIYIFFIYVETTGEKIFVVESKYNKDAELACLRILIEIVKNK